jgi:putative membrane protein
MPASAVAATVAVATVAVASLARVTTAAAITPTALRPRPVWALTVAVVALEIPYPLTHGDARNGLTVATVLTFCGASLVHAVRSRGPRYAVALLLVFGGGGFAAEAVGVHTGVPFGDYGYTGGLGPRVLDVPLVVPLAWVMMAHPSLVVAGRLVRRTVPRVLVAAVALASWDVFLDPQMVAAGHWRWADPTPHLPGVAGIPLSNFGGWLLVAVVLMTSLLGLTRTPAACDDDAPAVTLWVWTWLSSALAQAAFLHRPAVAGWGLLAMGTIGVPLGLRLLSSRRDA